MLNRLIQDEPDEGDTILAAPIFFIHNHIFELETLLNEKQVTCHSIN